MKLHGNSNIQFFSVLILDKLGIKMKKILLITDSFPYGPGETFLHPEIEKMYDNFSISIATTTFKSNSSNYFGWEIPVYQINVKLRVFDVIKEIHPLLISCIFKNELIAVLKTKKSLLKRIAKIVYVFIKARKFAKQLDALDILSDNDIIYTYWHDYRLLSIGFLLDQLQLTNVRIISRIHGCDLYNHRTMGQRQPFMQFMDSYLSCLFFISQTGYNYYKQAFGFHETCEYTVSRLGVFSTGHTVPISNDFDLSLISVASAIPLKRINLIVEALALIEKDYYVRWVHFGGGDCLKQLKLLANQKLGERKNISYTFRDSVPNSEIQAFYLKNTIDVFITTSSSEGIPVSIMEALAYGIPSIGTDVGGIYEIIKDNYNGMLLSSNPSPKVIHEKLIEFINLKSQNKLEIMKKNALEIWSEKYNAETNFSEFINQIQNL